MRISVLLLLVVFVISVFPVITSAETFNVNGYAIDVYWKQSKRKMKVWGRVKGGKSCKQLNLSIWLLNSRTDGRAHVSATMKKYNSKSSNNNYKAIDSSVSSKSTHKNRWHIDEIYTNCLQ